MCTHPRCGKASAFRLEGTAYGPTFDLCQYHGIRYWDKVEKGKLVPINSLSPQKTLVKP